MQLHSPCQQRRYCKTQSPKLENFKVNRCFKPNDFGKVSSSQLHHFANVSQHAYGAVTYLQVTNPEGDVHCSFVIGKSRLSPLKQLTIPRLELSAAVVATRLDKMVRKEIGIPISESIFWTYSTCFLGYIANEDKRFQNFVANRVAAIQEATSSSQWKHVGTKQNPADDASRGLSAEALLKGERWLTGQDFLWKSERFWPSQQFTDCTVADNDPEVKKESQVFSANVEVGVTTINKLFGRFCSWYRLKKIVAWILRYRTNLRRAVQHCKSESTLPDKAARIDPLSVEEMNKAEREILRHVQRESFREEIAILQATGSGVGKGVVARTRKGQVKKSSRVSKLDPWLMDGLLRVGRRLENAPLQLDAKHPIILPASHQVVCLIISYYHHTSGHSGTEHVLSMIREKFWIVNARAAVRKFLNACFDCLNACFAEGDKLQSESIRWHKDRITPDKPFLQLRRSRLFWSLSGSSREE